MDFFKNYLLRFHLIFSFLLSDVLHKEYFSLAVSKTPSMIQFNLVGFSERCYEEVISFF